MEENKIVPEKTPEEKKKENKNAAIGCSVILLVIALVVWFLYPTGEKGEKIDAYVTAQSYVKKHLKAPATAVFPSFDESFVQPATTNGFIITSYVDAQNSFGALIRSDYEIIMYKKDGNWYCYSFKLDGKQMK